MATLHMKTSSTVLYMAMMDIAMLSSLSVERSRPKIEAR